MFCKQVYQISIWPRLLRCDTDIRTHGQTRSLWSATIVSTGKQKCITPQIRYEKISGIYCRRNFLCTVGAYRCIRSCSKATLTSSSPPSAQLRSRCVGNVVRACNMVALVNLTAGQMSRNLTWKHLLQSGTSDFTRLYETHCLYMKLPTNNMQAHCRCAQVHQ